MNAKPIKPSYSILLMRDDCAVSTFRMRTFWFKLIVVLVLLLMAACALTVYGTMYYKERYQIAAQERRTLQAELSELRVQLQDSANLAILPHGQADRHRAVLGGRSQPYSVNSITTTARTQTGHGQTPAEEAAAASSAAAPQNLAGASSASGAAGQLGATTGQNQSAATAAGQNAGAATEPGPVATAGQNGQSATAGHNGQSTATAGQNGQADASAALTPSAEDMRNLLDASAPVTVAGVRPDLGEATESDDHPIKIANAAVFFEAGNKMRVSFDISNQPQKETLAGNCSVFVITRQGAEVKLTPLSSGSLTFRIERYKKMQSVLTLPDNISKNDVIRIKFVVTINDQPNYWRIFPYPLPHEA
ncbi:MAG: hypothetical protein LBV80_05770 [Deltaproteobacteria bacterium]|jgi:hypothetical protein|nr:hypothetical protein [Deltaproteobacteria bacterium]